MRIAAVLGQDGDNIVPLPDGPVVVILDTDRGTVEEYPNPGMGLAAGRRLATTNFLIGQRVDAVCTVPETFCSTSCEVASQGGIKFIRLAAGVKFSAVAAAPDQFLRNMAEELPPEELFKK